VKKAVIANDISVHLVDPVFADPAGHSAWNWRSRPMAMPQIYCDFSAYTDMAIGLAGLLGFRFPRNFDQPYRAVAPGFLAPLAHQPVELAARLSLHRRFGGSRQALWRTCLALFGTMVLGGLWHGRAGIS
jgi:D-alanyl-lipoteichoic acid acyltransferase DltB (MBOAT superfamily)